MPSHLYSLGAVLKNTLRVEPDHFLTDLPHDRAVDLFRRHVELVEVETTSYCNRTCSFCPNQFIDRRSEKHAMPDATWQAILDGLAEIDYDGTMVWSRYSEPLSEHGIVDRIRQVKAAAPKARIAVNSNGDYLTPEYLEELADAGLDRLWIDIYIPDSETYDLAVATKWHDRFLARIAKPAHVKATEPELIGKVIYDRIEIDTHVRNVAVMRKYDLSDRGGLIAIARRTTRQAPCFAPFKHLVIDNDGSIVVCCQLRSDSPSHAAAVVGRVGVDGVGLVDAYARLGAWRATLHQYGPKLGVCSGCNVSEYHSTAATRTLSALASPGSPVRGALRLAARPLIAKKQRW